MVTVLILTMRSLNTMVRGLSLSMESLIMMQKMTSLLSIQIPDVRGIKCVNLRISYNSVATKILQKFSVGLIKESFIKGGD